MKTFIYALILILIYSSVRAGNFNYPTFDIPEALKENADAVIRHYTVEKEIKSINQVTTKEHLVVTVFNKSAQHLGYFYEQYDDLSKITGYKMALYNKYGKLIKKAKKKDFTDILAYSQYSLYEDQRIIYNKTHYNDYPYTIEIEFTKHEKQTLFPGSWSPCPAYNVSVEFSSFTLKTNQPDNIRIYEKNLDQKTTPSFDADMATYYWELKNYEAIEPEPFMPYSSNILPQVILAPNQFEYDNVHGNLTNWEEFGSWSLSLTEGRDELTEETIRKIKEMLADAKTDLEKIRILYKYLQNNTRYVSIQLGIGGFQPFSAQTVDDTKYGDCKALSNYMKTLLKYAGVDSKYVLIKSGSKDIDTVFPYQQFNHVILCVPNKGDTVWLECTSQKAPFGYLSSRTQNKHCLITGTDENRLVKTPHFTTSDNMNITRAVCKLDSLGNLQMEFESDFTAKQFEHLAKYFYMSPKEQKEELYKDLNIPDLTINDYSLTHTDERIPEANARVSVDIQKLGKINGDRMFLPLNILSDRDYVPKKLKERKYPIVSRSEYTETDTITYQIPANYQVEYLPDTTRLKSDIGEYTAHVTHRENTLQYIREFKRYSVELPASEYKNVRAFFKQVAKADDSKVVLIQEN